MKYLMLLMLVVSNGISAKTVDDIMGCGEIVLSQKAPMQVVDTHRRGNMGSDGTRYFYVKPAGVYAKFGSFDCWMGFSEQKNQVHLINWEVDCPDVTSDEFKRSFQSVFGLPMGDFDGKVMFMEGKVKRLVVNVRKKNHVSIGLRDDPVVVIKK